MDTDELLRLLLVAFLVFHGLSHIVWFMVAWTPWKFDIGNEPWILPGDVTLTSWVGRIVGLVALVAMGFLLVGAVVLFGQEAWWRGVARWGALLSMVVVLPWWPRMPHHIGLQAIIANIVLMFLIALPLSIEILGDL